MLDTSIIQGYHAHIYFDAETAEQAQVLIEAAAECFDLTVGRMHRKPVGPHPMWSCQLSFEPDLFASVLPWLALNRQGLIVFTHPITDNDLRDHQDSAIWLGEAQPLNLAIFG